MRIFTRTVYDIATGTLLESDSYDYTGPLALCGDTGIMGDIASTLDGGDPGTDTGDSGDAGTDLSDITGDDTSADIIADTGEPTDQPAEEGEASPAAEAKGEKEVLPAALSKAIRELKAASPDHAQALKTLNNSYYKARAYEQVYSTPDEARTDKAALEAAGGHDGIANMRTEIEQIEDFDRMAAEGNTRVIEGLADQFPDGFKKLVPAAIERLSRIDQAAYRETLRGPLLQCLEGDGLIDNIRGVMEYLKAATTEPEASAVHYRSANYLLNQIVGWYTGLKQQETEFRNRYQDPRVQQLEQREKAAAEREIGIHRTTFARDILSYLSDTMRPEIGKILNGKTIAEGGRARFESNVKEEINKTLKANDNYQRSLRSLISQGKTDQAVNYAKPFIDAARRKAITTVYTDLFGSAPSAQTRKPAPQQRQNGAAQNGQQRAASTASDKPIPISRKPNGDDIDWDRDPKRILYVTGKAYLKNSGKLVTWANR